MRRSIRMSPLLSGIIFATAWLAAFPLAARGPIELDAAAPVWQWCGDAAYVHEGSSASGDAPPACTDIAGRWARCQMPDGACGRLEHSRIVLMAHQLRHPQRLAIAHTIRAGLEAEARDYDETDWLPQDPLYSLAGQVEVLAAPDAPWPDFLSDADRTLLEAATGRSEQQHGTDVFADTHEPAACRLLRAPATAPALRDARFRTRLAGALVRDILANDDRRGSCAARLLLRHGQHFGAGARQQLSDATASLLPGAAVPDGTGAPRRWHAASALALQAPGMIDDPDTTESLLRLARDQDLSPRLASWPGLPVRLGLMATAFPTVANDETLLLEAPEILDGGPPGQAIASLVAEPGWPALARTLDLLALVALLDEVADAPSVDPERLRHGLVANPLMQQDAALLLRLPAIGDGAEIEKALKATWPGLTALKRTTIAARFPRMFPAPDLVAAFTTALEAEHPSTRDAATWNLLHHCGATLPRMATQAVRVESVLRSGQAALADCATAVALPEPIRQRWAPEGP